MRLLDNSKGDSESQTAEIYEVKNTELSRLKKRIQGEYYGKPTATPVFYKDLSARWRSRWIANRREIELDRSGKHYRFTQDHAFGSPSTAAGVILARTANGRIQWKNKQGKMLKAIQMAQSEE